MSTQNQVDHQQEFRKKRSRFNSIFIRDLFLVFLIFSAVRLLMLNAGLVFIRIPFLDYCLWQIVKIINDPNLQHKMEIWMMRFEAKYLSLLF